MLLRLIQFPKEKGPKVSAVPSTSQPCLRNRGKREKEILAISVIQYMGPKNCNQSFMTGIQDQWIVDIVFMTEV